jgi:hypothetical protein
MHKNNRGMIEMMIKKIWILMIIGLFWTAGSADLLSAEMTGRDIMKKQKELHEVQSEVGKEIMLLVDKRGGKEKRTLIRQGKELEPDENRFLLVFTSPADIKGTSVLTWEHKDRDNDQWLYMPSKKKLQRIASGSKKNYFMGTDFTYEDMQPEHLDNFRYTIIKNETLNHDKKNQECWVIESVPASEKKTKDSGYSKRILWIEKKHYTTLKVEFYDKRDRLLKTQTNHAMKNVEGTIWRPQKTFMRHHQKNHKTLTIVTDRAINTHIDENVFTERYILTGKHVQ